MTADIALYEYLYGASSLPTQHFVCSLPSVMKIDLDKYLRTIQDQTELADFVYSTQSRLASDAALVSSLSF